MSRDEIKEYNLSSCVQCGTCTASCPLGGASPHARMVVLRAALGLDVGEGIWACTTCYRCQDRCPRGVRVVDALLVLREEAAKAGKVPEGYHRAAQSLLTDGHIVPASEATGRLRQEVGLSNPAPTTVYSDPEASSEVKKILKECSFKSLVEGWNG